MWSATDTKCTPTGWTNKVSCIQYDSTVLKSHQDVFDTFELTQTITKMPLS